MALKANAELFAIGGGVALVVVLGAVLWFNRESIKTKLNPLNPDNAAASAANALTESVTGVKDDTTGAATQRKVRSFTRNIASWLFSPSDLDITQATRICNTTKYAGTENDFNNCVERVAKQIQAAR